MNLRNIDPQLERAFLEKAVNGKELPIIADKVKTNYFSDAKIRECIQASLNCILSGEKISPISVSRELRQMNSRVKSTELMDLIEPTGTNTDCATMLEQIRDLFVRREVELLGRELSGGNLPDMIGHAQTKLLDISSDIVSEQSSKASDFVQESIRKVEARREARLNNQKPEDILFSYCVDELDKLFPYQQDDLVIIAARPAMGKTSFALNQAIGQAASGNPVYFASIEVGKQRLFQSMTCIKGKLNKGNVRSGRLDERGVLEYEAAANAIGKLPITISKSPALIDLISDIRMWRIKNPHGIGCIYFDYLQLIQNEIRGRSREQEVSAISRTLKELAKDLGCVVFALSQLSRAVESRGGDKRPIMSDLRESGAIEQDADTVMFLYRPEYYDFMADDEGNSTIGLAEIIIGKGRNMPTGTVKAQFIGKYGEFTNWGQAPSDSFSQPVTGGGVINLPPVNGYSEPSF